MIRFSSLAALAGALAMLAACNGNRDHADETPAIETPAIEAPVAAQAEPDTMPPRSPAPADARVYFVAPADGAVVSSPVHVTFGMDGMQVVPAGNEMPASGHHHIIIDADLPALDQPVPADMQHVHFGDGRKETDLDLAPGEHTLQLLFADYRHVPHEPAVYSERITVTVE